MADIITVPGAIIGYRRNGRPIRLQAGGSEGAPEPQPVGDGGDSGQGQDDNKPAKTEPAKTEPAKGDGDGDDKPLGTGGQKALESERAKAREAQKRVRELEKQVERFENADKSELEKVTSRAEKAEQRVQRFIDRTVQLEVRAAAADFADPSDAAAFLELGSYVDDDGEVDTDRIKADLADLLKRKPHLGKQAGRKGPKPDPSQGPRGDGVPDLAAQIAEAEKAGNHGLAIRLKRRQAALTTTT